ncbi:hypothetical protein DLD77_07515 [Chitinophaga alhagiae]|uniref:DUF2480 domain-containing protein n=1 Tax=Chitinophaga alhagiae TaxID=2203219 RepID=A0ABM6WCA6_9BACT|nr:DUF2480 family protein [Chitinophaga alhagiae]AWO01553.1 hypothetical protein DLD77_07515 [Chitinophaga alhagiae]
MDEIVNKVAQSALTTIDLEKFYPTGETVVFDMKDHLFMELILKEKDFRAGLLALDWEIYRNKNVAIVCTADAIVPIWAYMLVASYLQPVAAFYAFGDEEFVHKTLFLKNMAAIDPQQYQDQRVVVKGCGNKTITEAAYVEITRLLRPVVKSIMYGEPCSTVPVFKKK